MATGYVRSTDTWGVNSIPFDKYQKAGIDQLVFAANDPHLAQALANAAAHGVKAGIWIPAGNEGDPVKYAQNIKALQLKYGNVAIIPNIEQTGKGYSGSSGWAWNQKMMDTLKQLGVPPNMQVAVMGNQDDFNYKAYTSNGVHVTAEAFGAKTSDTYDPAKIRQRLIDNGVPPDMIDVMLAPGHGGKGGNSVFTVDDLKDDQLKPGTYDSTSAGQVYPGASSTDNPQEGPRVYTNEKGGATDAQNPRAVAYAKQRLSQLQKQGYSPADFGITGDATAQWRGMSAIVGAQDAARAGRAADYHLPPGTAPGVADIVNKIIAGATTPNTGSTGAEGDVRPGQLNPQQQQIIAAVNPNSQHVRAAVQPGAPPRVAVAPGAAPPVAPPRTAQPLLPHQMVPLTPEAQRVGPMQQAIQVAAAMKTLRQLRPTTTTARFE
jgi:hypothetical protein